MWQFHCHFNTYAFCIRPSPSPPPLLRFDHATGVMYTCDAFGMHYCTDQPYDVDIKAILPHYRWMHREREGCVGRGMHERGGGASEGGGRPGSLPSSHRSHFHQRIWFPPRYLIFFNAHILSPLLIVFRFYYDCLMKPNAKSVTTAIRKVAQRC